MSFKPTDKQREAQRLLAGPATHVLLEGGSRSGKTFWFLRAVIARAVKASGSSHVVLRFRFNHLKASILADTWPKVLKLCYPGLEERCRMDKQDWYCELDNGSKVWFGGLDDKERVEKILGQEHSTIYLNECSQITYDAYEKAVTRLAQVVTVDKTGEMLPLRMYCDANPPGKGHWLYRLFHELINPDSKRKIEDTADYVHLLMNPEHNLANLPPGYIRRLEGLSKPKRDRFLRGLYADENPHALFSSLHFDMWRAEGSLPDMQRVVVAVDPSGADEDHPDADEIGIVVAGLGVDGNCYILEDLTMHAAPAVWGRAAAMAVKRHGGDCVVGERNFGGAMVKFVIQSTQREVGAITRYKEITASRGKVIRAEPVSALVEQGHVRMVGQFEKLEDELLGFSTTGYTGDSSPNRADAAVFAITELFPAISLHKPQQTIPDDYRDGYEDDPDVDYWKVA